MARVLSKSAFTLVELVVVMAVFGVVATFGTEIVARVYESHIQTVAINLVESKIEIALTQISKRFQRRIIKSTSVINPLTNTRKLPQHANYNGDSIIEWIGVSDESFKGGWSGFVDLKNTQTTKTSLKTLGSELNKVNTLLKALTNNNISLESGSSDKPAIIFKSSEPYIIEDFYREAKKSNQMFLVKKGSNDRFELVDENFSGKRVYEHYKLVHTAYALVPKTDKNKADFTLMLHYNYEPWNKESYKDGSFSIIAENVTKFRFLQERGVARFVLCMRDKVLDISTCKEKVVF